MIDAIREGMGLGLFLLGILFIFMVFISVYMKIASYIGKRLGIGDFLMKLWKKIRHD
ncbi:hypothetical protein [Dethiothermospora halolimnae]|uniref:hypothetical protein n=1 Tax=Dethiothermospora halolimnae TaxID=3114390 RepID=UPI003CCBB73C